MSPTLTCDNYFNKTANIFFSIDVEETLSKKGIVPSNTAVYPLSSGLAAFVKTPLFTCQRVSSSYLLMNIEICFDLEFNIIDCQGPQGDCGSGFSMPLSSMIDLKEIRS
jgi:hypothetical protein